MDEALLTELKNYVGFAQEDEVRLRVLGTEIAASLPHVWDVFHERLMRHPQALAVFTGGNVQLDRQKEALAKWLRDLFSGRYDEEYLESRTRMGQVHAEIDLPQHYIFAGMEVIRQELLHIIAEHKVPGTDLKIASINRLLSLDLAIMMEAYKAGSERRVRERERTAVEEKLTRAEHLAEIGQMAASLAHEIKNPLAGISGAIQIIGDAMDNHDPHRPIVGEILGQIKRLDAAVKDLLVYARPTPPRDTDFDLDRVIRRVLTILHEEPAMRSLRIKYNRLANIPCGRGDEAQLEQLVMNLIINAAEASGSAGTIRISTTYDEDDITFAVQDWGQGMSPEIRSRAFEPFYTTKAKGTGLGLAICRRIIDAHSAKISVDSVLGEGTTVIVSIPRSTPG